MEYDGVSAVDSGLRRPGGNCAEGETGVQEDAGGDGACLFCQGGDGGIASSNKGGGMGRRPLLAHLGGAWTRCCRER